MLTRWSRAISQLTRVNYSQKNSELGRHLCSFKVEKVYNVNAEVNLLLIKWMKDLEKIFYGNIVAYDSAKQDELQNVIWRNVFSDDGTSTPTDAALLPVQAMSRYVRRECNCLSLTDREAMFSGNFMFTSLGSTTADTV
ncbi:hypothetical protein K7X08_030850 [Anisodus acutangulus]|uniref:Ubiquinol-cytochrome c chaperone domain-containing protein n=1 Tax=Anisodus acutangulus TaxID=402998 RepID=A0A9Q1M347_9SOLA|nr:hypothetical protein K7X08_030850 [Anisodus acutangulus]